MKKGKDIQQLAAELTRIKETAKDLIVPTAKMKMAVLDGHPMLALENGADFKIREWPHQQLASYADIPKSYYDRLCQENPYVLSSCVNHGFQMAINALLTAKRPRHDVRLLRTIDGQVRGFLSDRYRILDCYDLFACVAPTLIDKNFTVISSELTEKRMYIKAVTDKIQGEVKVGHPVQYGICISSSDVGAGSVRIEPIMYELRCLNGMVMEQTIKRFHIGRSQSEDDITELLTNEAKDALDRAFWLTVRDTMNGTMQLEVFNRNLNMLRIAADQPILSPVPIIVESAMKEVGVSGEKAFNIMADYLANGADGRGLNKWALANAFTYAAQSDEVDYDTATDLERAGAKIIELPRSRWEILNKKAA